MLAIGSVAHAGLLVNWVAAALLAFTIAFYVLVYTMWLKRRTPQNIVIGGAAGAFPPMIGWAAATGSVGIESIVLFLIIFMWTPPHFWALALYRARDYERAGVPMLPVVAGPDETRKQIVIYSALLVPLALWPAFMGLGGAALRAGLDRARRASSWRLRSTSTSTREGREADRAAKQLFAFSILYLFGLFAALLVERGVATLAGLSEEAGAGGGRRAAGVGAPAQDELDRHRAGAGGAGGAVLRGDAGAARRQRHEPAALGMRAGQRNG